MFSAVKYFCRKIDRIRFDSDKLLREIMGSYFDATYEGILEPIPITQITSVCPEPLGEGGRGIVYKATWSCPQKMDMPSPENITVAVKAIKTKDRGDLNRFFKELKANVIALQGSSVSCVRCFGISKTRSRQSSSKHLEPSTESSSLSSVLPHDTFLLVVEYAKDGFLTKYLLKTLNGDISDWPRIRDVLIDLTVCIFELHEVGIIHRDLHENNVLIGTDDTSMDEDALERPALKVSDLGESALSELTLQGGTYGDRNVWAPEIIRGRNYSKASDIYAMGSIMEKTVSLQWEVSLSKHGIKTTMTPKFIVDVMRWCRQPKASDRPSAEEASSALGDHMMETEFEMEEVDPDRIFSYEKETENHDNDENEQEIPP
ncbi:kinase-like protein [Acephala macrosclerotiorum]|nr:kinase-like protein [Acephala macrosclerotiorum]